MKKFVFTKKKPEKRLLDRIKTHSGRGNTGRITVRHRGGGVKKFYRQVDFGQAEMDSPAKVISIEYDPYRTAHIMLLEYVSGKKTYRLAPQGIKEGDMVISSEKVEQKIGNRMRLENIPVGAFVYDIEVLPGAGGKMMRSAGAWAQVMAQEGVYTHLLMPSKEIRKVLGKCFASVGKVSHAEHRFERRHKAGQARLKGQRPEVRGSAMSPRAHPHGGGEARSPIGMPGPKTPWGKPARGVRTRKRKYTNKFIIKRRR